jgi:hypothetical protein
MAGKTILTESWNKSTNNMKIRSNPSLNMHQRKSQNMKKNKTLPILKNGSLRSPSGELKSCMVKNFGQVILCNTPNVQYFVAFTCMGCFKQHCNIAFFGEIMLKQRLCIR